MNRLLMLGLTLLLVGCDEDTDGPGADLNAFLTDPRQVSVTLRNTGDDDLSFIGCPAGPYTLVEQWTGSWVPSGAVNDDCPSNAQVEWRVPAGEDLTYDVSMPPGRFRFFLWIHDGLDSETRVTSNGVDVF